MSKPTSNSVTPKSNQSSTPVLPPCSVPYRWILHVGRCVNVYFDRAQPKAVWKKHPHHTVQILVFGVGAECIISWEENGEWHQMEANGPHLWVIGAGVPHQLEWRREALRIVFYVEPAFVTASSGIEITSSVLFPMSAVAKCDAHITQSLCEFEDMGQPQTPHELTYVESLSFLVTTRLLRAWTRLTKGGMEWHAGLSGSALVRIEKLIDDQLDSKLSLSDMAREVNMSKSNFVRLFTRRMGISPGQYLISRRIQKAKELLRSPDFRIGEIALAVGFSSQGHFDGFFKKWIGVTPKKYRTAQQSELSQSCKYMRPSRKT